MSGTSTSSTVDTILQIADVLTTLAGFAFPASATIKSIIAIATMVGKGVKAAEPSALALWNEITAIKAGGGNPTPEQWKAWDAAADKASADLDAAAARVIAKG